MSLENASHSIFYRDFELQKINGLIERKSTPLFVVVASPLRHVSPISLWYIEAESVLHQDEQSREINAAWREVEAEITAKMVAVAQKEKRGRVHVVMDARGNPIDIKL